MSLCGFKRPDGRRKMSLRGLKRPDGRRRGKMSVYSRHRPRRSELKSNADSVCVGHSFLFLTLLRPDNNASATEALTD